MKKAAGPDKEREMRDKKRIFPEKPPVCGSQHAQYKSQVMAHGSAIPAGESVMPDSKGGMA
jgi:hypothetical protein